MNNYFKTNGSKQKVKFKDIKSNQNQYALVNYFKNDSNALENYNNWLHRRQDIHHKLGKELGREYGNLLMNIGDEIFEIKEEKCALEYTRIPQEFDKYRGNPAWWDLPPKLYETCRCRPMQGIYFYQKTRVQKNEIPEIERVGLSTFIKGEKMLIPRIRNIQHLWRDSEYRKKRFAELSSLLANIIPIKPKFDNLIVVGRRIRYSIEDSGILSKTKMSSFDFLHNDKRKTSVYDLSLQICLKINGIFFHRGSESLSEPRTIPVTFEYDLKDTSLKTKYITFENVGRVTLRLYWRKFKKFELFHNVSIKRNLEPFCFNKNELVIIPGQVIDFPIWFETKKLCTVIEKWEIKTLPKLWSDDISVSFLLQAITHIDTFMKQTKVLKKQMELKIRKRIINDVFDEIMKKTNYPHHKSINYNYCEAELFEASNLEKFNFIYRSKYLYNKNIVKQLKELYNNVRQAYHPNTWNLNIKTLQHITRMKDLICYAEERTKEFSQHRIKDVEQSLFESVSERQIKKTSNEAPKMKNRKNSIEFQRPNEEDVDQLMKNETNYGKLMKLVSQLTSPCVILNTERFKYFQIYSILNTYFTRMSIELFNIKPFETISKKYVNPYDSNRLTFELFDDLQMFRTKRVIRDNKMDQPKPVNLRNIPSENIHKIYSVYFNKSVQSELNVKKNSSAFKSKDSIKKISEDDLVIPGFDPYDNIEKNISDTSVIINEDENSKEDFDKINYTKHSEPKIQSLEYLNLYVIVYSNLEKAVETMVDTLESSKEYKIPIENLKQLKSNFDLVIQDEVKGKEVQPINPFTDKPDREYFEQILTAHLNDLTHDYYVCGKVNLKDDDEMSSRILDESQSELEFTPQKHAPFKYVKEETQFDIFHKNKEIQSESINFSYQKNVSLDNDSGICKCPSEFKLLPTLKQTNDFYYSDDEIINDSNGAKIKLNSEVSIENISSSEEVTEVKKISRRSKSISLFREWSKKKCILEELEKKEN